VRRLRRPAPSVTLRAFLVLCLTITVGAGAVAVPAAVGDPGPGYPSQEQVDRAKERATRTAHDVGAIKGLLLLANQRLEQAAVEAERASEAYNGAVWRLEQARTRYAAARADARRARQTVADQRGRIGALVAQSYQQAADLTSLNAMMSADGPQGVLDQYVAFQGASSSLDADYKRFAASDSLAQVFESKARQAKATQVRLAAKAEEARNRAVGAAAAAQAEAARIRREKDRLITELARAQNISVSLARQRQQALEEIARKRAEERARREAVAAARAKARAEATARAAALARQQATDRARDEARADRRKARRANADNGNGDGDGDGNSAGSGGGDSAGSGNGGGGGGSTDTPPPPPPPAPAPQPPAPSGGADQAIRFAKQQLGEPYRWGATGPGSWDCSGLTMKAWASAGKYLPHYSVAQYDAGTPISVSDLRRGDLVFWSSNGRPSGIHHVAMYIGNGQIIHAPRTGRPVEIDSMYYWIPPDFFVRV
jgi:peptidoglycan DL-endopeptidase CwlO